MELLIAVTILAIIGTVLANTVVQIITVNAADSARMNTVKQVENALHYINRDAQMAVPGLIQPNDGNPAFFTDVISPPFSEAGLHLQWIDYTDNDAEHFIVYSLVGTELKRTETINSDPPSTTTVARYIDGSVSNYSFINNQLTVTLTATINGFKSASESRTLQVKPRIVQ